MIWYAVPICFVVVATFWLLYEVRTAPDMTDGELLLTGEHQKALRREQRRHRRDLAKSVYVEAEVRRLRSARERFGA